MNTTSRRKRSIFTDCETPRIFRKAVIEILGHLDVLYALSVIFSYWLIRKIYSLLHPFWFLSDTMLRVNIGSIPKCVTKNPKTAQARWKIWILGDLKLGDLILSWKIFDWKWSNSQKTFLESLDLYWKISVRNVTKISVT